MALREPKTFMMSLNRILSLEPEKDRLASKKVRKR